MNVFGGGGDGGAGDARAAEARRENAIADGIGNIQAVFGQFTPTFYDKRRQAFLDYAKPQLDDQFADARKQLTYSLDRAGLLDSSARAQKEAELAKLYGTNSRTISDQALGYENTARDNVANAEDNLIGTVAQTGNARAAADAANSRAAALSQPDVYSPIGQMFGTFTNALQTQAALEQAGVYTNGAIKPAYNTGLFSPGAAVKVY